MKLVSISDELKGNSYPGRGIIIGKSSDGKNAVTAYFIMGRSENSRNRVFTRDGEGIRTEAFDPSKLVDPSLIIYAPVRVLGDITVVTNGDQTDTVFDFLKAGKTFEEALRTREFEPDGPNFTPRISGIINKSGADFKVPQTHRVEHSHAPVQAGSEADKRISEKLAELRRMAV